MKVVILAAGRGARLEPLTQNRPKALVPVRGIPLIDYSLQFVAPAAPEEILVVAGAHLELMASHLNTKKLPIRLIDNPDYDKGNLLSLATALPFLHNSFLLMNADHIYPRTLLKPLLTAARGVTAACDFNRVLGADDMKIKLDAGNRIAAIHKRLTDYDGGYVGMTVCTAGALDGYRKAFDQTARKHGDRAVVEDVLATLATGPQSPRIFDVSRWKWFEVDTPEELAQTEIFLERQ